MEKFDVRQFLNIFFDIMAKIANDLQPKKTKILEMTDDLEKALSFQKTFNDLLIQYEPELEAKYNLTFNKFNENTKMYQYYIDQYLNEQPLILKKYNDLKQQLRLG
ncbi:hypothetical protein NEF87_004565 [Candidatus Lokiarchaeum ossiferum]|uniref:Uncharacterized protein n=1 Tax=Candidatus Lokiarchaeum ossiferum TaxID=2951803 RepID=A0ABY6HXM5_9ARCH|nr:hypothetical protein NEF87_004565 [Candidatus Lokiarchaeum sp. B-35]